MHHPCCLRRNHTMDVERKVFFLLYTNYEEKNKTVVGNFGHLDFVHLRHGRDWILLLLVDSGRDGSIDPPSQSRVGRVRHAAASSPGHVERFRKIANLRQYHHSEHGDAPRAVKKKVHTQQT